MLKHAMLMATLTLAVATPAHAVTGLMTPIADSPATAAAAKTATASCPAGYPVIGGGGVVETPDPMHARRNVVLTRLQPVHPLSGADSYVVTGEETGDGAHGDWWVRATARCAQPLPGQHMV